MWGILNSFSGLEHTIYVGSSRREGQSIDSSQAIILLMYVDEKLLEDFFKGKIYYRIYALV